MSRRCCSGGWRWRRRGRQEPREVEGAAGVAAVADLVGLLVVVVIAAGVDEPDIYEFKSG